MNRLKLSKLLHLLQETSLRFSDLKCLQPMLWDLICRKMQWHYLTLVAIAVAVRPTSAIVWLPFCALHVVESRRSLWRLLNHCIWKGWALLCSLLYWHFISLFLLWVSL